MRCTLDARNSFNRGMRRQFSSRRPPYPLATILLLALLLRALIPAGYMPSADRPFTLDLCPDGLPTALLAHSPHAHATSSSQDSYPEHAALGATSEPEDESSTHHLSFSGHCIFAGASSVAGPPHLPALATVIDSLFVADFERSSAILKAQRYRIQQPRAPPLLS